MAGFSQHDLLILLGVFTRNAMEVAGRHAKLCGRNGVTKDDLQTALKYEVFDFVGNPDTFAELMRIKTEMIVKKERNAKKKRNAKTRLANRQ